MFYDQTESEDAGWSALTGFEGAAFAGGGGDRIIAPASGCILDSGEESMDMESMDMESMDMGSMDVRSDSSSLRHGGYERELVQSVWEFSEIVSGNDSALWRKDEFGDWIYRFDYGRRTSEFGWEIFDPGVGRHAQGVYAMRPMQWQSYIRQYESFA